MSASGVVLKGCALELSLNDSRSPFGDRNSQRLSSAISHCVPHSGVKQNSRGKYPLRVDLCSADLYDKLKGISLVRNVFQEDSAKDTYKRDEFGAALNADVRCISVDKDDSSAYSSGHSLKVGKSGFPAGDCCSPEDEVIHKFGATQKLVSSQPTSPGAKQATLWRSDQTSDNLAKEEIIMEQSKSTKYTLSNSAPGSRKRSKKNKKLKKSKHRPKSHILISKEPMDSVLASPSAPEKVRLEAFCKPVKVLTCLPKPKLVVSSSLPLRPKRVNATNIYLSSPRNATTIHLRTSHMSPRKSSEIHISRSYDQKMPAKQDNAKITKVYFSDKQSGVIRELGLEVPCAPPVTPAPDVFKNYEYVPCLNDIRSQRAIKVRLEAMEKVEKKKQNKLQEERLKQEKISQKELQKINRKQQRQEIYALNKAMTAQEHKNFEEFCAKNGIKV